MGLAAAEAAYGEAKAAIAADRLQEALILLEELDDRLRRHAESAPGSIRWLRLDVGESVVRVLVRLERYGEALGRIEALEADLYRVGAEFSDPARQVSLAVRLRRWAAASLLGAGRAQEGLAAAQDLLELLPPGSPTGGRPHRFDAMALVHSALWQLGRYEEAVDLGWRQADELAVLADAAPQDWLKRQVTILQATLRTAERAAAGAVAAARPRAAQLEAAARRALDLDVPIPLQSTADVLRFFAFEWSTETGVLTAEIDGWLTTVERLDRAAEPGRTPGDTARALTTLSNHAVGLADLGRWPDAVERAAEAMRLASAAQPSEATARSRAAAEGVLARRGMGQAN